MCVDRFVQIKLFLKVPRSIILIPINALNVLVILINRNAKKFVLSIASQWMPILLNHMSNYCLSLNG